MAALLLANRGIGTAQEAATYFHPTLQALHDPFLFRPMPQAVEAIMEALSEEKPIRVIGDYDQDGVAATVILVKGLRYLAAGLGQDPFRAVSYQIPDRIIDGYGINPRMVEEADCEGVGLIVTCDNGVAAFEALEEAQKRGLPVILTDHHQIHEEAGREILPPCVACLNPHSRAAGYPFPDLCGAGVAFKLIQALFQELGEDQDMLQPLLAYAALGTVCDLVPLQGENRVLVALGLSEINQKRDPGLMALLLHCDWTGPVTTYTVGFVIGPCINASGRLLTARLGVELFLEEDAEKRDQFAQELVSLNRERQQMTRAGEERALQLLTEEKEEPVVALYLPDLHESICGLIAGRVKETINRPCLVFTDAEEGKGEEALLKGSGRSIEAYDMFHALARHQDQYVAFGGHAMACGITIRKKDFTRLRTCWQEESGLVPADFQEKLYLDAPVRLDQIGAALMWILDHMAPFGMANPKPVFGAKGLSIRRFRLVGQKQNVLQLQVEEAGRLMNAILFQADQKLEAFRRAGWGELLDALLAGEDVPCTVDLCFQVDWNEFRGQKTLQLRLKDLRFHTV